MSAPVAETRRRGLFSGLFKTDAGVPGAGEMDPIEQANRALWDEVGLFLCTHRLSPTPEVFAVVHAHVAGEPRVRAAIAERLRNAERVDAAFLASLRGEASAELRPEFLTDMATKLEGKLAECFRLVGLSTTSLSDFGAAIDQEVEEAAADPHGACARLARLTKAVGVANRAIETQLDETRRETERLRADLQAARRAAERDHLTGLANRRHFDNRLAAAAAEADARPVLVLCDIDDFKLVNDAHGHETGDRVLRFFANTLDSHLKGKATVARYGGEEFACLFDGATLADAHAAIADLREAVAGRTLRSRVTGATIGAIRFSAGLTIVHDDAEAAMRRADHALYAAKRRGKDRSEVESDPASLLSEPPAAAAA